MSTEIELREVSFAYKSSPQKKAIDNISLKIKGGEFLGLIGGTGQGKTTLLLCLNGLIPHFLKGEFSGNVFIDGVNSKKSRVAKIAPKVGLVFQNPEDQIFSLEVRDEISFGPRNLKLSGQEIIERVEMATKLTGIEELVDRETSSLSAGQKQLVCIASVLAMNPDVIVLDEPTAELDFKSSEKIYAVLDSFRKQGKTVIVVEHKMGFLSKYADRIIVLDKGMVVLDGSPDEVFSNIPTLSELGISPPTIYHLRHELLSQGVNVSFSNVGEAVEEIKKMSEGK